MISMYSFQCNDDYYVFDYRNLLILEVDKETFEIICDEKKRNDILEDYIRSGLFIDEVENKYEEVDSDIAYISIPTIHSCNMKCKYCFAEAGEKYKGENRKANISVIDHMLTYFFDKFKNCSRYRIDFVSGGEPLMNFDIIKYVYEKSVILTDKEIMIWLSTNGLLLSDNIVGYMDDKNIQFGVSIDGTKETHDRNRIDICGKGTYDRIINNIQAIQNNKAYSRRTRDIWVLTTVTTETESLVEIIEEYKRKGIKRVQMKVVRVNNEDMLGLNENTVNHFIQLYTELVLFFKTEIDRMQYEALTMVMNRNDMLGKIIITLLLREPCITRCMAGREKLSMTVNGDIYPCESFIGIEQFKIGNINEEFVSDNMFTKLNVYKQLECNTCWVKYICGGGCYYRNYVETGDIKLGSRAYCTFYKKLVELSIDLIAYINKHNDASIYFDKVARGKIQMEW